MSKEVFADRFGEVVLSGSTMRIDLVSLSPGEKGADGHPTMRFRQRVVLPIEGFVQSYEMMQRMIGVLRERGLIAYEGPPPIAVPAAPGSPNFPA